MPKLNIFLNKENFTLGQEGAYCLYDVFVKVINVAIIITRQGIPEQKRAKLTRLPSETRVKMKITKRDKMSPRPFKTAFNDGF